MRIDDSKEETPEHTQVNVHPFLDAEDGVRGSDKAVMYWKIPPQTAAPGRGESIADETRGDARSTWA